MTEQHSFRSRFDREKFQVYFNHIQDFITLKILALPAVSQKQELNIHGDIGITSAAKFMQYLWNLNKERKYLDEELFYNQVLNDYVSLKIDYFQWKGIGNTKDRFSFCLHPFLLTPETKSHVLNIESILNQRKLQNVFGSSMTMLIF